MIYPPLIILFRCRTFLFLLVFVLVGLSNVQLANAYSESTVYNPLTGKPFFVYKIYDIGEDFDDDPDDPGLSTYTLSSDEKNAIVSAGNYWAEIFGPGSKNTGPVYFTVGTYNNKNADAISPVVETGPWTGMTALAAGLIGNFPDSLKADDPVARIRIGNKDEWAISKNPTQLPDGGDQWSLTATMVHEIGHALGISSNAENSGGWSFGSVLSKWDEHLYDQNGNQATAGGAIVGSGGSPTNFLVEPFTGTLAGGDADGGLLYFSGAHVQDVLQGALLTNPSDPNHIRLPGIPVNGWESDAGVSSFEGSHIELTNGMMSHQNYRNYTTFMEAELAILQDIGYDIDRKNFFGYSVYGDGVSITNTNGYFGRNAEGTAYLPGVANTASFGVGLHIYGSYNKITQAADLLANGVAGIGARVDGAANTLRIAQGVSVQGNGAYGTGLLVAYGKDHQIIHQGSLSATGVDGIAARFDFGDHLLGNGIEYRGSYIRTAGAEGSHLNIGDLAIVNIDGPLASSFDVTGSLTGRDAAIYISKNALVSQINIMRGSSLSGAIVSNWDVTNDRIDFSGDKEDLVSTLSFGYAPQADGSKSNVADPNFSLRYDGNISAQAVCALRTSGELCLIMGKQNCLA